MLSRPRPSRVHNIVGLLLLTLCSAFILLSGTSAISQETITARLNQFAAFVSQTTAANGNEGQFTYDNLKIKGWLTNKHAVVNGVNLELTDKSRLDTSRWLFSTDGMNVLRSDEGLLFVLANPINITENGQPKTVLTFSTPVKYIYQSANNVTQHSVKLPGQAIFTPANAAGGTDIPPKPTIVTYADNAVLTAKFAPESRESETHIDLRDIKIVSGDGVEMTIASLLGNYREAPDEANRLTGKLSWAVADVSMHSGEYGTIPYSVSGDIAYSSDVAAQDSAMPGLAKKTDITIEKIMLTGSNYKVTARGTFSIASVDPLPFGAVEIDIENAGNFLASDLVLPSVRDTLKAALEKATGQQVTAEAHLVIPVKRESGGMFYIGDIPFEALMASLVKDAITSTIPPAATAPSETKPAE